MARVAYNFQSPLANNEVLFMRKGVLYKENSHERKGRFILIRLFTYHRYSENKILTHLFAQAARVDRAAAQKYLDTAAKLIDRAKKQLPQISRHRIIRWLQDTHHVAIRYFEQKLLAMLPRVNHQPAAADAAPVAAAAAPAKPAEAKAPVEPVKVPPLNKAYTKEETLALMREALKECPKNFTHRQHLEKWIRVCENRETIIKNYQAAVKREGRGHWYNEPYSGYVLHGELQDPIPVLRNGSEFYAMAYNSVRNDPKGKASFFANVFSGGNACYEGNFTTLKDWYQPRMHKNQDLNEVFDETKDKFVNIGEMHRVFHAYKFREYFDLYHDEEGGFDDLNESHKKICDDYAKKPNDFMKDFKKSIDHQSNLTAFILEKKWLPRKCSDEELTETTIEEKVKTYYDVVFGDDD